MPLSILSSFLLTTSMPVLTSVRSTCSGLFNMHLLCFILFGILLHNNFPTESKTVTPDGVVSEAFKGDAFRQVTTHLIETHIDNKLGSCALRCTKHRECVSFNFGNRIKGKHDCQLLKTDKYNSGSSYVTSTDFHYFYPVNKCMDPSSCHNNGSCYPDYDNKDYHCVCKPATEGRNCEKGPYMNCWVLLSAGYTANGVYQIDPDGKGSFPVYCDMTTDGGGWTVFQRRTNKLIRFDRGWHDYKIGFGNLTGEFWLGLDKIYRLTKRQVSSLRVDLVDLNGNKKHAVYSSFSIADESDFYRLNVSGYYGTAGNALASANLQEWNANNKRFTTLDVDNDEMPGASCAVAKKGGWWYGYCSVSDLNGVNTFWSSTISEAFRNTQMKLK